MTNCSSDKSKANVGEDLIDNDNHKSILTTQQGVPVTDDENSLKVGQTGPTLLEDIYLREKLFHFDHERIPERVVHARGYGAHGYFENYDSLEHLTCADIFQRAQEKTPVFVRFSTVAGNKGSADLARDVRGFAVKFYTNEGNWDLVGNNIPVFFIQDAVKFPDLIHAAKAEPDSGFPQAQTAHDNFWDFISLMPESMHMIMWAMSDRAIPRSFRFMEGFGVHTFKLINAKDEIKYVKFHWKPMQGLQSVTWNEALKINGMDPDFHRRDLWQAIQRGEYPEWELGLQIFDEEFLKEFSFDVLDATKLIPEEQVPVTKVGKLVLNKCVDNFFAETEQVAFCTQNIIPGIDFSEDPLLQGRNFSYLDTQLKRLGSPNFTHLPINAPKCPLHLFQQDGHMSFHNPKGRANYNPNSWSEAQVVEKPQSRVCSHATYGGAKMRQRSPTFSDHYSQARQFYLSQTPIEQKHIVDALVFELSKVNTAIIRERVISHLLNIEDQLAASVAQGLGLSSMPASAKPAKAVDKNLPCSNSLSILKSSHATFAGRRMGILLSHNADVRLYNYLKNAIEKVEAQLEVITPQINGVYLSDKSHVTGDANIKGGSSVLYDAVALLINKNELNTILAIPEARDFITDAYAHNKYIGYNDDVKHLFAAIGLEDKVDEACIAFQDLKDVDKFLEQCHSLRYWQREMCDRENSF